MLSGRGIYRANCLPANRGHVPFLYPKGNYLIYDKEALRINPTLKEHCRFFHNTSLYKEPTYAHLICKKRTKNDDNVKHFHRLASGYMKGGNPNILWREFPKLCEKEKDTNLPQCSHYSNDNVQTVRKKNETNTMAIIYELLPMESDELSESEKASRLLNYLSEELPDEDFLNLVTISELYRNRIMGDRKLQENPKIVYIVKMHINRTIREKHYDYLFKCFELMRTFNIVNVKLFQKIVYLMLRHSTRQEEKIVSVYFIIKHLYYKKIYDHFICKLLHRYIFKPFFYNIMQNQTCMKSSFLIFAQYATEASRISSILKDEHANMEENHTVLEKYAHHFSNALTSNLQLKDEPVSINDVITFQCLSLKCDFYNGQMNSAVKKHMQAFLNYITPQDLLLLSSNMLLSFTKSNQVLLCRNTNWEDVSQEDNPCGGITHVSENYRNFLATKYVADVAVRTYDHYITGSERYMEHTLRYLVLSSYCHFALYSNWWTDTAISSKMTKKKKNKTVIRARMPYKNYFPEKIAHLLNALLHKFDHLNDFIHMDEKRTERSFQVEEAGKMTTVDGNETSSENILMEKKYMPYYFKAFMRVSLFNTEFVKNTKYTFFFERLYLDYINGYIHHCNEVEVGKSDRENGVEEKNGTVKKRAENTVVDSRLNYDRWEMSLYEISSMCECFFLLKELIGGGVPKLDEERITMDASVDIFEKTLYIYLEKVSINFLKKKLDHDTLNRHYLHNVLLSKYLINGNNFFNYYLLLRVISPLLFSSKFEECLDVTKHIIAHIMSLLFVKGILTLPSIHCINENASNLKIEITNIIKWENNVISINNQRRIRKKTKEHISMLDFTYAGEFIRPSSLYILCLKEISKHEDVYDSFIKDIFQTNNISSELRKCISTCINELPSSTSARISKRVVLHSVDRKLPQFRLRDDSPLKVHRAARVGCLQCGMERFSTLASFFSSTLRYQKCGVHMHILYLILPVLTSSKEKGESTEKGHYVDGVAGEKGTAEEPPDVAEEIDGWGKANKQEK
ncbi:conserved Plasmodium protein, unknown function [Plasmodium ovale curtisi]|uniref:Uncharacterized protein n=1 Tax=Plasmodium ovale curtisi TaxID=864141 RepID=A0A1A8VNX4_PLAOA|nr:conserved Plasmodium protein, unknown function [Plasmodium ovale curtisi]